MNKTGYCACRPSSCIRLKCKNKLTKKKKKIIQSETFPPRKVSDWLFVSLFSEPIFFLPLLRYKKSTHRLESSSSHTYNTLSLGAPMSLLPSMTKFIANCLRRPERRMLTGSIIFAPTMHESRFVPSPYHKTALCHILT